MDEKIHLQIITPAGAVCDTQARSVQLPLEDGSVGIMSRHAPMMCAVTEGVVKYTLAGERRYVAVTRGVAQVQDSVVTVLVSAAERAEEIDVARAAAAECRARERLRKNEPGTDTLRARAALHRALARQRAARLKKK